MVTFLPFLKKIFYWLVESKTQKILENQKIKDKKAEILIRALVKMKAIHEDVNLLDVFEMNPELFSERKLVEFLYSED